VVAFPALPVTLRPRQAPRLDRPRALLWAHGREPITDVATRLAAALVLGLALLQLRRALADRLALAGAWALDEARGRPGAEPSVPYHVLELANDLRAALRSRRHFEGVLWPRLAALTPRPLVRPPVRLGRGPSLASLRDVIAAIEKQP